MKELIDKAFAGDLLNPKNWFDQANHLLKAADLLKTKADELKEKGDDGGNMLNLLDTNLMLCSYAVENILKGIIIFQRKDEFQEQLQNKKILPKILQKHDLIKLADKAGFPIQDDYQHVLMERLSRAAVWQGRYPIPIGSNQLSMGEGIINDDPTRKLVITKIHDESDQKVFESIINNLTHYYNKLVNESVAPD